MHEARKDTIHSWQVYTDGDVSMVLLRTCVMACMMMLNTAEMRAWDATTVASVAKINIGQNVPLGRLK